MATDWRSYAGTGNAWKSEETAWHSWYAEKCNDKQRHRYAGKETALHSWQGLEKQWNSTAINRWKSSEKEKKGLKTWQIL